MDRPTPMDTAPSDFRTTRWTMVLEAGRGGFGMTEGALKVPIHRLRGR